MDFAEDTAVSQINRSLTNHPPDADQIAAIESIREAGKGFGRAIVVAQPGSRERSLAITKLEEAVMWAVKGVILNG